MGNKTNLRVDWCSAAAARYACEHFHYSRSYPVSKSVCLGCWEDGQFIGAVIFSWGANKNIGSPYGLELTQCCELVRVALREHQSKVSRIVAIAIKLLRRQSPGLRLVVSYADPVQEHVGTIYQAGNWVYAGETSESFEYRLHGQRLQKRAFTGKNYGKSKSVLPPGAVKVRTPGKHKYLMPLDDDMKALAEKLRRPYPKKRAGGVASMPADQAGGGARKGDPGAPPPHHPHNTDPGPGALD